MTNSADSSTTAATGDSTPQVGQGDQVDGADAAGDAVSGVTADDDGAPTPTGSIPPGPGTPDEGDVTDATALPPLGERMY